MNSRLVEITETERRTFRERIAKAAALRTPVIKLIVDTLPPNDFSPKLTLNIDLDSSGQQLVRFDLVHDRVWDEETKLAGDSVSLREAQGRFLGYLSGTRDFVIDRATPQMTGSLEPQRAQIADDVWRVLRDNGQCLVASLTEANIPEATLLAPYESTGLDTKNFARRVVVSEAEDGKTTELSVITLNNRRPRPKDVLAYFPEGIRTFVPSTEPPYGRWTPLSS